MSPIVQVRKGLTTPMALHPTMLGELGNRAFVDLHAENDVDLVSNDGVSWCELELPSMQDRPAAGETEPVRVAS